MSADVARIAFAQREYRTVTMEDPAVRITHPLAMDLEYNTLFYSGTDATAFGNYVLGLRKLDRWTWSMYVNKQNYSVGLGDTINVTYPRFGLSGGKNFIVKRIKRDSRSVYDELTLYGPQ